MFPEGLESRVDRHASILMPFRIIGVMIEGVSADSGTKQSGLVIVNANFDFCRQQNRRPISEQQCLLNFHSIF